MKKETRIKIGKIILGVIATAGILGIAAVAPNTLRVLDLFYDKKKSKYDIYKKRYYVNTALDRLRNRGLIEFKKENEKTFVRLTNKGAGELLRYQLQETVIKKPKIWDKKWRVIIFDIKEKRRFVRDEFRNELVNLGFLKLQNSVWVHPYDCEEIIIMLKSYLQIGKDILYMNVEKIENDKWLKHEFGLD